MLPVAPACEPIALPPLSGIHVETVTHTAGSGPPGRYAHFHDACEIVLFDQAAGMLLAGEHAAPLGAHSLVVVPSMMPHDFRFGAGPAKWTLAQVAPWLIEAIHPAHGDRLISATLTATEFDRARILLDWLARASGPADILAILTLLFSLVKGAGEPEPAIATDPARPIAALRLRAVLDRLHARPAEPLTCAAAASLAAMSPAHFSRTFRRTMGSSFSDYVATYRLQVAAHLLLTTALPIASIAFRAGFTSPSRFTALFRRRFAVTPKQNRHVRLARQSGNER